MSNISNNNMIYSGYAIAVGVNFGEGITFSGPSTETPSNLPVSAIAPIGGVVTDSQANIVIPLPQMAGRVLRIGRASTEVVGRKDQEGNHVTRATTTLENVNIADIVTADKIVATVTSVHSTDPSVSKRYHLAGSRFENLQIMGNPIQFEVRGDFMEEDGYLVPDPVQRLGLFSTISNGTQLDRKIDIPELGTLDLGALEFYNLKAMLTMLRVDFNAESSQGAVAFADLGATSAMTLGTAMTNGVSDFVRP